MIFDASGTLSNNETVVLYGHSYNVICPYCGGIKKTPPRFGRSACYDGSTYHTQCRFCQSLFHFTIHHNVTFTSKGEEKPIEDSAK